MRVYGRRMLVFLVPVSIIALLATFGTEVSGTSSTIVYVNPPTVSVPIPGDFNVGVDVENVTGLFAWQARLNWDPNLLNCIGVTEGDLKTGGTTMRDTIVNQSEGWVKMTEFLVNGSGAGLVGSGRLADLTFHSVALGECVLYLNETKLFNATSVSADVPPYPGDADGNSKVDGVDVAAVAKAYGSYPGHIRWNPNVDFYNDSRIDYLDLACVSWNFGRLYPAPYALKPAELVHEAQSGYVVVFRLPSISWKWLDREGSQVWMTADVTVSASNPIRDFNFTRASGQISFGVTSAASGYCNVSIPKLLMDGGFSVLLNDTETASILTWNKTHSFVYFTYEQGTHNVAIVGEIVTRIRSLDLLSIADVNGDGKVNIVDVAKVAVVIDWNEDP